MPRLLALLAAALMAASASASGETTTPDASYHDQLCGGSPSPCLGVQGRLSSRFVQAKAVHVDGLEGFARVQGETIVRGEAAVRRLEHKGDGAAGTPMMAEVVSTRRLEPLDGEETIRLDANLQVNGRVVYAQAAVDQAAGVSPKDTSRATPTPIGGVPPEEAVFPAIAFLEEAVSIRSHLDDDDAAHRQWRLVAHDTAATAASLWKADAGAPETMRCHDGAHPFMAVRASATEAVMPTLSRRFGPLPPHTHLELVARVHLVDAWRGATAFAKIDGGLAWLQAHGEPADRADSPGLSLCGSAFPHDRLSVPVKVIVPHSAEYVDVAFGGAVAAPLGGDDAAAHAPVLGLDDVAVLVN